MEHYQVVQNRTNQTIAVIDENIPTLSVAGNTTPDLTMAMNELDSLAQIRDTALADFDQANNAENQGFLNLQRLTLALPQAAEGELDDSVPAESALLDLLSPAYAIKPRTTELALERGKKVFSALTKINLYLGAQTPPRDPITSGGSGIVQLTLAMNSQPPLEQAVDNRAADVKTARTNLHVATTALDRLNKRFYSKLQSEARSNPALAAALDLIITESAGLPGTLGIVSVLQGGTNNLQVLVAYEPGTYDGAATSTIEWMVVDVDQEFSHTAPADPSGNALGPFTVGTTVKLRTRVTNSNGTTTGSVRELELV